MKSEYVETYYCRNPKCRNEVAIKHTLCESCECGFQEIRDNKRKGEN